MPFDTTASGYSTLTTSALTSPLMQIMQRDAIVPGSSPSYESCKIIYSFHPLGARIVDAPINMAMSQQRTYEIGVPGEEKLIDSFNTEWNRIGNIGADQWIFRVAELARMYGIGTLAVNVIGKNGEKEDPKEPLDMSKIHEADLYFNLYDPLNTAGSLVLNQDPAAADFMHPRQVIVGNEQWNSTKTLVLMHEQPIWIQWSNSAFGFVGRSVYQRAFYPLKSFVSSMIADNLVQTKLGLLVYKAKSPASIVSNAARSFMQFFRTSIKGAETENVVSIGETESLESLDLQHVSLAGEYSRTNILKNIASACDDGMPASILTHDTMAEGFGEGSEDAKNLARYIDRVRIEMRPAYDFMTAIVQRRAWNPAFFASLQAEYPSTYRKLSHEAALDLWRDSFKATWPNLLTESDSDKAKGAESRIKTASEAAKTIMESVGPRNKMRTALWLADILSNERDMWQVPLILDEEEEMEDDAELPGPPDTGNISSLKGRADSRR